jgi:hypothetical protein
MPPTKLYVVTVKIPKPDGTTIIDSQHVVAPNVKRAEEIATHRLTVKRGITDFTVHAHESMTM